VEGADLVAAGIAAGARPQAVFVRAERAEELAAGLGLLSDTATGDGAAVAAGNARRPPAIYPVDERVAAKMATLDTPADVMAVFPLPRRGALLDLPGRAADLLLVYLDGVQDPGNVGTLLRAAVAFGAAALVTSPGSADLYGPKTVRASMGAVFGLPLFADVELAEVVRQLALPHVYGLAAHGGTPLSGAGLQRPAALVVGAERAGLSSAARAAVTELVTIPLAPGLPAGVESLNAGVAGAIALYECARRADGAADDPRHRPAAPAKG
jgi:TrmH family RNA methyltransferase